MFATLHRSPLAVVAMVIALFSFTNVTGKLSLPTPKKASLLRGASNTANGDGPRVGPLGSRLMSLLQKKDIRLQQQVERAEEQKKAEAAKMEAAAAEAEATEEEEMPKRGDNVPSKSSDKNMGEQDAAEDDESAAPVI